MADGWVARNFDQLKLRESEEMKARPRSTSRPHAGEAARPRVCRSSVHLALGNPPTEILKAAEQEPCDLIAMTTHGHRFFGDLIHGSTITAVRHKQLPVPMLCSSRADRPKT